MADRVGQQFGNYRLVRLLGQSDFASVYLGEHLSSHAQVAIKLFSLQLTGDDRARFQAEVSILVHLTHPALLPILEGDFPSGNQISQLDAHINDLLEPYALASSTRFLFLVRLKTCTRPSTSSFIKLSFKSERLISSLISVNAL